MAPDRSAKIDGRKMGTVEATWNPNHYNFAVNRHDLERAISGKREGKVDEVFVVATRRNGTGRYEACRAVNAEELYEKLRAKPTIDGRFGPFWALTPDELGLEDDEPF